ncbi:hypothetical protein RCO48_15355 [Peribacillus frigoritolerans]|nr:hypothetical protein [Peribacillus frigoritolerans]
MPTVTSEDRAYLLKSIHYMFPEVNITDDDIESSWAGVRPLILEEGKDPSEISRKDEIWEVRFWPYHDCGWEIDRLSQNGKNDGRPFGREACPADQ